MTLPIVRLDRIAAQPWANGAGTTRVLLTWPHADAWSLRISVAEVDRNGPFSALPGIERWFAVLDGRGVVLALPDGARVLEPASAPLCFDGALAPGCELVDGPTQDLNLMVRQAAGRGGMQRARLDDEWVSHAPWRALFAWVPVVLQINDTDAASVGPGTLVWSDHGAHQRWRLHAAAQGASPLQAWWLEFHPQSGVHR